MKEEAFRVLNEIIENTKDKFISYVHEVLKVALPFLSFTVLECIPILSFFVFCFFFASLFLCFYLFDE